MNRLLAPLNGLYGLGVELKNLAYDRGWCAAKTLRWPVVSIGNVCAGGSGKTPVVIALARLLQQRGLYVDVLSRGYGRRSPIATERVDPEGDAGRFGDEPLLIAREVEVPVYVGASRWAAGQLAERVGAATGVHLLDDGFQHRRLARNFDVVVVHPGDVGDRLLPGGRLRELLSALRRADALVLREDDRQSEAMLHRAGIEKPVWRVRRVVKVPAIAGAAVAFCGIARPDEFFDALQLAGIQVAARIGFADHHTFTVADVQRIGAAVSTQPQAVFLTTEKDIARMSPAMRRGLELIAPLIAVPLVATLLAPEECLTDLLAACGLPSAREADGTAMRE